MSLKQSPQTRNNLTHTHTPINPNPTPATPHPTSQKIPIDSCAMSNLQWKLYANCYFFINKTYKHEFPSTNYKNPGFRIYQQTFQITYVESL